MVLTTGRALEIFLVSLLYEHKCLRIDLFKINFCLNVPFIIWFLYVLNSITFALRTPAATTRKEFSLFAAKLLRFMPLWWAPVYAYWILRCSFRIIFILIRYVATIVMKASYDEALFKIAFKTLLRFSAGINLLSYSVHVHRASWHFKQKVCLIRYRVFRSPVRPIFLQEAFTKCAHIRKFLDI